MWDPLTEGDVTDGPRTIEDKINNMQSTIRSLMDEVGSLEEQVRILNIHNKANGEAYRSIMDFLKDYQSSWIYKLSRLRIRR